MAAPLPEIKSNHSLVKKYVTDIVWSRLSHVKTKPSGFTLEDAISCAIQFDDLEVGIYAGDWESYTLMADAFNPIIREYHHIKPQHFNMNDMDAAKITSCINPDTPVLSTKILVGRNINGYGLSPGITREQRFVVEGLMKKAFVNLQGDLAGSYIPLRRMEEEVRQELDEENCLFVRGDRNLKAAGMERDWPEGRGIFHNKQKTFLTYVNGEEQLTIISIQKDGDLKGVFKLLDRGINALENSLKTMSSRRAFTFMYDGHYGYIQSSPTNLGTGMRVSVRIELPGYSMNGLPALQVRCEQLNLQVQGTLGEFGGQTGNKFDLSNKPCLGSTEVDQVLSMIDGVNKLYEEDLELQQVEVTQTRIDIRTEDWNTRPMGGTVVTLRHGGQSQQLTTDQEGKCFFLSPQGQIEVTAEYRGHQLDPFEVMVEDQTFTIVIYKQKRLSRRLGGHKTTVENVTFDLDFKGLLARKE